MYAPAVNMNPVVGGCDSSAMATEAEDDSPSVISNDGNNNTMSKDLPLVLTSLKQDMLSMIGEGFLKLETALDRQSQRIFRLENTLDAMSFHNHCPVPDQPCDSYGEHRHAKRRRDHFFQRFMEKMERLWASTHQHKVMMNRGQTESMDDAEIIEDVIDKLKEEANYYLEHVKREDKRLKTEYSKYQLLNEDCVLYRIIYLPQQLPVFNALELQNAQVSLGGGEFTTFDEGTLQYLDEHFEHDGVYRVPPFWFHTDKIGTKRKAKNDLTLYSEEELWTLKERGILKEKQITNILTERNADRAVEDVIRILYKWAEDSKENMFIFTNYKYQDYLKNVKPMANVTDVEGDHDIMAISQRHGVLFFQVKSCEMSENDLNIKHKAQDALCQTMKDKFVFLQSNRDLPYVTATSPIYGFVALPNLKDSDLNIYHICFRHTALILTGSSLKNINQFSTWLQNALSSSFPQRMTNCKAFTLQQFRELCGRYVGLASSVSVPTTSQAIQKSGKKLSLNLLTPTQLRVRDSQRKFMIISGDTGTGKSLILASKARQLLQNSKNKSAKCKVNIVTCTDINDSLFCALKLSYRSSQQLEKFLSNTKEVKITQFRVLHQEELGTEFKVTPELLVKTIRKLTSRNVQDSDSVQHVFMDEVPFELLKMSKKLLEVEIETVAMRSCVWLSVSTHTYRVNSRNNKNPCWIKDHMPSNFQFEYLELVKRVPRSLFNVMKEIQAITGNGHSEFSKCGHVIEGLKPLLYRLEKCSCLSRQADHDFMRCECVKERIRQTFCKIVDQIGLENMDDVTVVLHNFAIHGTSFKDLKHLLDTAFTSLNIELIWSTVLFKSPLDTEVETTNDEVATPTSTARRISRTDVAISEGPSPSSECDKRIGSSLFESSQTEGPANKSVDDNQRHDDRGDSEPLLRKKQVMVVDTRTFVGCEGKILISLDQCGMFQYFRGERGVGWHRISLVRCVGQYIYVAWPEEESAENWRKFVREYEMDVRARKNLTEEQMKFREDQISQARAASYEISCLEKLVQKELFIVK